MLCSIKSLNRILLMKNPLHRRPRRPTPYHPHSRLKEVVVVLLRPLFDFLPTKRFFPIRPFQDFTGEEPFLIVYTVFIFIDTGPNRKLSPEGLIAVKPAGPNACPAAATARLFDDGFFYDRLFDDGFFGRLDSRNLAGRTGAAEPLAEPGTPPRGI